MSLDVRIFIFLLLIRSLEFELAILYIDEYD
jgi:hypothetical protein